jgi:hypothetical protein
MSIKTSPFYLLVLLLFLASCMEQSKKPGDTVEGITLTSMTDAGIDSSVINNIDTAVRNGTYPNIHSLLIARNNKLLYEKYWPGKDESWGEDLGIIIHGIDSLHDIRSISKSIVSSCIALPCTREK